MSDALKEFFERLTTEADLHRLVQEKREEDLHLEFKQKHDTRHGGIDEDDRKNFSKSLSGFANADGGITIFGIEAPKLRAKRLKPISGANEFRIVS